MRGVHIGGGSHTEGGGHNFYSTYKYLDGVGDQHNALWGVNRDG